MAQRTHCRSFEGLLHDVYNILEDCRSKLFGSGINHPFCICGHLASLLRLASGEISQRLVMSDIALRFPETPESLASNKAKLRILMLAADQMFARTRATERRIGCAAGSRAIIRNPCMPRPWPSHQVSAATSRSGSSSSAMSSASWLVNHLSGYVSTT